MTNSYLSFRKPQSQPGCEGGRRWAGQDWQSGAGSVISAAAHHLASARGRRGSATKMRIGYRYCTGKKTPGGAGTHTGHTGHTGARGQTDHTDEPHNHPPKPKDTNPHENRDRLNSRKNSRKPGVDRSPRPTQKRPPPANPTLPPPAPRAPPRACSKAVGEMKARAADA